MKVLQTLEDLQGDTLHLQTENRNTDLCERSISQANPQRLNPFGYPVVCHICHCSAVRQSPCPARVAHRLSGGTFFPALFLCQFAPAQNPTWRVPGIFCKSQLSPGSPGMLVHVVLPSPAEAQHKVQASQGLGSPCWWPVYAGWSSSTLSGATYLKLSPTYLSL